MRGPSRAWGRRDPDRGVRSASLASPGSSAWHLHGIHALCKYSVHTCEEQLTYLPLEGSEGRAPKITAVCQP